MAVDRKKYNRGSLIGKRFNRLVVVGDIPPNGKEKSKCRCVCDCGAVVTPQRYSLLSGNTGSCGCYSLDRTRESNSTHGMSKSAEYLIWSGMLDRCLNPRNKAYKNYGGRGVAVCDEWRSDFAAFFSDVGSRPSPCHSIDRIDVNGNYEPNNVRWATPKQQARNKRKSRVIFVFGEKMSLAEAAEKYGINPASLKYRIDAAGMPPDVAVSVPVYVRPEKTKLQIYAEGVAVRRKEKSIVGKRFGGLVVLEERVPDPYNPGGWRTYLRCLCDCGREKIVSRSNVVSGRQKTCGKRRCFS